MNLHSYILTLTYLVRKNKLCKDGQIKFVEEKRNGKKYMTFYNVEFCDEKNLQSSAFYDIMETLNF